MRPPARCGAEEGIPDYGLAKTAAVVIALRRSADLFDLDFTLVDNDVGWRRLWPAVADRFAERYPGFDPEEFQSRCTSSPTATTSLLRGTSTTTRIAVTTCATAWSLGASWTTTSMPPTPTPARARSTSSSLFADAVDTIRAWPAGSRSGSSRTGRRLQRRKLRLIGIEDEVDAVAVSEEIGVSKPDPEAYARAVEMLGLEPDEVAMVGDHVVNDVAGAPRPASPRPSGSNGAPARTSRRRPPSTGAGRGAEAPGFNSDVHDG